MATEPAVVAGLYGPVRRVSRGSSRRAASPPSTRAYQLYPLLAKSIRRAQLLRGAARADPSRSRRAPSTRLSGSSRSRARRAWTLRCERQQDGVCAWTRLDCSAEWRSVRVRAQPGPGRRVAV